MKKPKKHLIFSIFSLTLGICFLSAIKAEAKPGDAYSPEKAIAYANSCFKQNESGKYVAAPSTKYGAELCAGYVSQCLREGGMTEDSSWYWKGIGNTPAAWRLSVSLYNYLKACGYPLVTSPNSSDVTPGDVIFYNTNSGWGHCAICVGKTTNGTPLINAYNNPHYQDSNWTLSYKSVCVFSMTDGTTYNSSSDASTESAESTKNTDNTNSTEEPTVSTPSNTEENTSETTSSITDPNQPLANGTYTISPSDDTTKAVGISSASDNNAEITLSQQTGDYTNKFIFQYIKKGYYNILFFHSGKALTEKAATTEDGEETIYSLCQKKLSSTSKKQRWKPVSKGKNQFTLKNAATSHLFTLDEKQIFTILATTKPDIQVKGETRPETLKHKECFFIYGEVTSNYNLSSISISLLDKEGKEIFVTSDTPNAKTYDLHIFSPKVKFRLMDVGEYVYVIKAKDETGFEKTLVKQKFQIVE